MARRILYNPADFLEAQTPFFDNIVGAITDQTERIQRNLESQRAEKIRQQEMEFQEGIVDKRIQASKEHLEIQLDARSEESEKDRHASRMSHLESMQLGWAKLGQDREKQFSKEENERIKALEDRANQIHSLKRKTGLVGSDAPINLRVAPNENGEYGVYNIETGGDPQYLGSVDQYVQQNQLLYNFAETFLNGKNVVDWARNNLYDSSGVYAGDQQYEAFDEHGDPVIISVNDAGVLVDADGNPKHDMTSLLNMVSEIKAGIASPATLETIANIMDQDSKVGLLFKGDEEGMLQDQVQVNMKFGSAMGALIDSSNYMSSVYDVDKGVLKKGAKEVFPAPFTFNFMNDPEQEIQGQTIGGMRQNLQLMASQFDTMNEGHYNKLNNAILTISGMAEQYINQNHHSLPDHLRSQPPYVIIPKLRINAHEAMSPNPKLKNLFELPSLQEIHEKETPVVISSEFKDSYESFFGTGWMGNELNN